LNSAAAATSEKHGKDFGCQFLPFDLIAFQLKLLIEISSSCLCQKNYFKWLQF
jgi:hypothetical protein